MDQTDGPNRFFIWMLALLGVTSMACMGIGFFGADKSIFNVGRRLSLVVIFLAFLPFFGFVVQLMIENLRS